MLTSLQEANANVMGMVDDLDMAEYDDEQTKKDGQENEAQERSQINVSSPTQIQ